MTEIYSRRIIEHLRDRRYQPREVDALAAELGLTDDELVPFHEAVASLVDQGQVVIGDSNSVTLPPVGREMIGIIRMNERGFGFVVPDSPTEHGDLFVPEGRSMNAMTGDRVRANVRHDRARAGAGSGRSPYTGQVVEIIQRADKQYVGVLMKKDGAFLVKVDGKFMHEPIVIRDPEAKNAKLGDKVVIEIIEYPTERKLGEGVITQVVGESGEPDVETQSVMIAYGLNDVFPKAVVEEARTVTRSFDDEAIPADREDLTNVFICTIDPPDAKDYDDAISIRRIGSREEGLGPRGGESEREEGTRNDAEENERISSLSPRPSSRGPSSPPLDDAVYELGVHIAHVSSFVKPGSAIDEEAYKRGNSCYLPRKVVPMLPEILSNGICSLQEGVNRHCLSAFMRYNAKGEVVGQRFSRSVIRSAKRLTYLEAQALIDDDIREARRHAKTEPKYPSQLIQTLKLMDELAKVIRARRMKEGMIVLGLPDVELVFDDSGRVVDAVPEDDAFTHKLIEMFMVEANEATARLFDTLNVPMIRRIHPDPPTHDMTELRSFARVAGYNIPANPSRMELQTLLETVRGKPAQHAVHMAVLRTLSKAEYAPLLIGHFALASEHYTHFTSPIRRYPDLIIHRGLDAYLDHHPEHLKQTIPSGKARGRLTIDMQADDRVPDVRRLNEIGRHCSGTERNAEAAERDLRTYLVLDLLSQNLGDDYDGTVTGVTGSGIFVQLDRFLVDGFISVHDVSRSVGAQGDRWQFNKTTGGLVAMRSGRTISIGSKFTVRVANVDTTRRKLDLVIVSDKQAPATKPKKLKPGTQAKQAPAEPAKETKKKGPSVKQIKRSQKKKQHRKGGRRGG